MKAGSSMVQAKGDLFYTAFANASIGIAIAVPGGNFIHVNQHMCKLLGYSEQELLSMSYRDITHPEDIDKSASYISKLKAGEIASFELEKRYLHRSGHIIWVLSHVSAVQDTQAGNTYNILQFQDITRRKQVEITLRKSEEKYRTIFENTGLPGVVMEEDTTISMVNKQFEILTGYLREEVEGKKSWRELVSEADVSKFESYLCRRVVSPDLMPRSHECRIVDKQGRIKTVLATITTFPGTQTSIGFFLDITEHRRAEKEQRSLEDRFKKAFNCSLFGMAIVADADSRFIDVNDSLTRLFQYERQELVGHTPLSLNLWARTDDRSRVLQLFEEQGNVINHEAEFRTKSGEIRIGLISMEGIHLEDAPCTLVVIQDVTELKQLQKEMLRLQSLDLVGQMAAAMSHEIRNPLTTVRGFIQLLGKREQKGETREIFDLMVEELDRASSIITEYLSLSKDKKTDLKPTNLNYIVRAIYPLIQADCLNSDKNIALELGDIPDVPLDEKEMRQLILNLTRNGLEAMSAGGTLTISTSIVGADIVLAVKDEGKGIDRKLLSRIGTPFFTTKGNGTGLGLAVCHSIAHRHNAQIYFETAEGGTTVSVRFKYYSSAGILALR